MRRKQGRREFLQAIGVSAFLAPFIPVLNREAEAAASAGFPRRLLLTFAPNGTIESQFWPSGTETGFTFPAGQITEPLAPYRASLIFPRNLDRKTPTGDVHPRAMASLYTGSSMNPTDAGSGYAKSPSIDQILANKLPQQTALKSLALSVWHDEDLGGNQTPWTKYMTYAANNQPVLPYADPYQAFSTLMFSGGPMTPAGLDQVRAQRRSVIDLVLAELDVLDKKVDTDDRIKVQNHIDGLRDLEKRIEATSTPGSTMGCVAPTLATGYEDKLKVNDAFPDIVKMQTDIMVAALACDRTRIASLQWSRTFSMLRHTWIAADAPQHHTNSHNTDVSPDAVTWQIKMSRWYCEQLATLLGKLSAVKEGDGTLLDNMLVVWSYDMNIGFKHVLPPHIAVLAGKLGGKMNTGTNGRLIDFKMKYDWTQMLVTICHAMGATDVNSVGDMGVAGEIPGVLNP